MTKNNTFIKRHISLFLFFLNFTQSSVHFFTRYLQIVVVSSCGSLLPLLHAVYNKHAIVDS